VSANLRSCSQALHNALKADDAAWSKLVLVGHMQEVDEDGEDLPGVWIELKNCHCQATLSKLVIRAVSPTLTEDEQLVALRGVS
jgi:hypothetical protein